MTVNKPQTLQPSTIRSQPDGVMTPTRESMK